MRRSEWRRRADDPKTPLGWWWRGMASVGWPLHLLVLSVCFALVWGHPIFLGLPLLAVVLMEQARRKWTLDLLHPMLPEPAPEGQFRAKVRYHRGILATGRDDMALCVVDGWLHAEGVRSGFALRPEDVQRRGTRSDRRTWLELSDGSTIHLQRLDGERWAVLERWLRNESPEGEPTFPPATAHPQETARWSAWVVGGTTIWPATNLFGTLVFSAAEVRISLMLTGLLLGIAVTGVGASRFKRLLRIEAQAKRQDALAGQALPLQGESSEPLTAKRW